MWKPLAALSGPLACLIMLVPLAPDAGAAALPPSSDTVPAMSVEPINSMPVAVSKSGRYVVLPVNGRLELRDLVRDRLVKRFPTVASPGSVSISDNGRYVTYTVPGKGSSWNRLRRTVRIFDRRTGKTHSAATAKSGKALQPRWRSTCVGDAEDLPGTGTGVVCDEGIPLTAAPQLDGGQISGNGRYVVFCANYTRPDRIDLYIKDWRTKSLKRINGACRYSHESSVGTEAILRPTISEDGRVILLPGFWNQGDDNDGCWEPTRALLNRRTIIDIGGRAATMTHDGRILSSVGALRGCDDYSAEAHAVSWFDVATRTSRPTDLPGLRLTMLNASRHGRYVTFHEWGDAVPDAPLGTYEERWLLWDRTAGVRYDLAAALLAQGYRPLAAGSWYGHKPSLDYPVLSGDGRTAFLDTDRGAVAVRWSPGP